MTKTKPQQGAQGLALLQSSVPETLNMREKVFEERLVYIRNVRVREVHASQRARELVEEDNFTRRRRSRTPEDDRGKSVEDGQRDASKRMFPETCRDELVQTTGGDLDGVQAGSVQKPQDVMKRLVR